VVHRCHDPRDPDQLRACKRLRDPSDREAAARLAREAAVLARLDHPHIVRLVDHGPGWLVLEHVPGGPLRAAGSPGPMRTQLALRRMRQLADAVACLHAHHLAHRDLSAENVRVRPDGWHVLIDLGLCRGPGDPRLTAPGQPLGTPAYRPPDPDSTDPRAADLYAMGVLFYELLEGHSAFEPMAEVDLLHTKRQGPLQPTSGGPGPRALVAALTQPDPSARPTAAAVHHQLGQLLEQAGDTLAGTGTLDAASSEGAPAGPVPQALERYELVAELGRGGMGVVYQAWDPELQRAVALKMARLGPGGQARFRREARAVSRLRHPNIVQVLDFGQSTETLFYTMELVEGPSLQTHLHQHGPVAPATALRWARALALGLEHAHAEGIVHRDVKPANILLAGGTTPRLTDFGVALRLGQDSVALTRDGELLGTPLYMAPEQVQGARVDGRADVYALGAVLYEMLCGRPPHRPDHPARLLHQVLHERPPAPSSLHPGIPPDLDRVCARALAKRPEDRYACMAALAEDLQRVLDGQPIAAQPTPPPRRRLPWRAGAALLLGAGLSAGAAHWLSGRPERTAAAMLTDVEAQIAAWSAEGDHDQADAAFAAFAETPAVQGTAALSRGWLRQAERLRARGADHAELEAVALAFDTAQDEPQLAAALVALADALRARGRWADLDATAALAASTLDTTRDRPEVAQLIAEGRVLRRELSSASGPAADVLRALSRTTPTDQPQALVLRLPGAPGEPDQVLLQRKTGAWSLHPADDTRLDQGRPLALAEGAVGMVAGPGRLVVRHPPDASLHRVTAGALTRIAPWPGRPRGIAPLAEGEAAVSVGHRGAPLSWVALDSAAVHSVHPPSERADSAVEHVAAADFDQDGTEELMLLGGAWRAFDLRVLEPATETGSPAARARHRLADRTKLGHAQHLSVLHRPPHRPLALVSKPRGWSSRVAISESQPGGQPDGLYTAAWDGAHLDLRALPTAARSCRRTWTGDIDGDGLDDAVADCEGGAQLYQTQPDGSLAGAFLRGVRPAGLLDLDGDGDTELVAVLDDVDDRLRVLGTGTSPLPPVADPRPGPLTGAHPGLDRAEALAQVGLVAEASERLEALAVVQAELRSPALLRAAQLLAQSGDHARAEARFLDAALRLPEADAQQARLGAADAATRDLRLHDALTHLQPLLDTPLAEEAGRRIAAIEALGGGPPPATWSFGSGLPDGVRVGSPLGVRVDPLASAAGGVRLRSSGDTALLELPVVVHGEALRIEAELSLERLEWAAGLALGLESPSGAPLLGARLDARGGGQVVFSELRCPVDVGSTVVAPTPARPAAVSDERIRLRVVLSGDTLRCSVSGLGAADHTHTAPTPITAPPPGPYRLTLRGTSLSTTPAQVIARLHTIEAEGLTAVVAEPSASSPLARARQLLATNRPTAALASLDRAALDRAALDSAALDSAALDSAALDSAAPDHPSPGDTAHPQDDAWLLHRLVALDDSGQVQAAQDALAQRLDRGQPPWLPAFLRSRPERWTAWAAETLPPAEWLPLFHHLFMDAAWQHPEDRHLRGHLQRSLDALDTDPPPTVESLTLMVLRAHAFLDTEPHRATRLLEAAVGWATQHLPPDGIEVGHQLALAHRHLATLALRTGDRGAAFGHLHAGLAASPSPELTADAYRSARELQALQADPRWSRIDELQRRGRED
jgi:serine/threonine protein kinase